MQYYLLRIKAFLLIELRSAGYQTKMGTLTLWFVSLLLHQDTQERWAGCNKSPPTAHWHYQQWGWMARPQRCCTTHWQTLGCPERPCPILTAAFNQLGSQRSKCDSEPNVAKLGHLLWNCCFLYIIFSFLIIQLSNIPGRLSGSLLKWGKKKKKKRSGINMN